MKFRGGYDIMFQGRPSGRVEVLPEPKALYLSWRSYSQCFLSSLRKAVAEKDVFYDEF